MWFDCLSLNENYEAYCEAKRNGDVDACAEIEQRFPRIAELFADWDDIFVVSYAEWIKSHSHLFFASEPVIKFVDAGGQIHNGTVAVAIPVGLSKADLNRLLKAFVNENKNRLCCGPKYPVNGHITEEKLLTLSRGAMAYDLYASDDVEPNEMYRDLKAMREYSYTNVARSFLANAVLYREQGIGKHDYIWSSPPPIPKTDDGEGDGVATWSYEDLEPYAHAVGKWIAYYEKCIASAIAGVFPAKT
ncbi:hypothetical protein WL98_01940 [Burkholderia multivorans]|nr:hypothetical protein WL98_01940 [Burkholderia multivorans]